MSWFYIILDNPRCGRERDYPLYGIDRERGLFYICYIQERGYEMNLRQQLMDTVDRLYVGQSFPLSEANFLKHNINELLTNNEYLFQECERGTEQIRKISKVISERESLSPKDMTVEEIQEELGYAIKVVGERA